jgi:single-strand DNA-binding protein
MNDTYVTVVGNAVDSPNARRLENGTTVCNFRVASTARRFDREAGKWADGDSLFLKVTCWRQLADNALQSIFKGDPVVVVGRLFTRSYEVEGQRRSSYEMEAVSVGHDLARGVAEFTRTARSQPTYEVTTDTEPGGATNGVTGGGDDDEIDEPDFTVTPLSARVA